MSIIHWHLWHKPQQITINFVKKKDYHFMLDWVFDYLIYKPIGV